MLRRYFSILLLAAFATPAVAQQACTEAFTADGEPTYIAPSSGHSLVVDTNSEWVRIELGDIKQTCSMSIQDRSKAGLGDTWFPANAVHCKTFDAQLLYASPRDGGELLLVFDGMVFYPKCEE
jgi:hypothetical protein